MSALDLPLSHKVRRRLHNGLARLGMPGWKPVALRPQSGFYILRADRRDLAVPSAKAWLHHRFGWDRRLADLYQPYGIGDRIRLRRDDCVIDIGAGVGEIALGLAGLGVTVLAIEGDPLRHMCLAQNVAGEGRITALHALVWKEPRAMNVQPAPGGGGVSIFRQDAAPDTPRVTVQAHRLDDLANGFGPNGIAFLKCAARGAEAEVLRGATETLRRTRRIALDSGPRRMGQENADSCAAILQAQGFSVSHSVSGRKVTFGIRR